MSKNNRLPLPTNKDDKEKLLEYLYYNIAADTESAVFKSVAAIYKIAASSFRRYKGGKRWKTREFEKRKSTYKLPKTSSKEDIVTRICEGIAAGYTIESMCEQNGLSSRTFVFWRRDNPQFEKQVILAKKEFDKSFEETAILKSKAVVLADLEERTTEEKRTIYKVSTDKEGKQISIPQKVIVTQKKEPANSATAKYLLDNFEFKEVEGNQNSSTSLHAMAEEALADLVYDYLKKDWFDKIPD